MDRKRFLRQTVLLASTPWSLNRPQPPNTGNDILVDTVHVQPAVLQKGDTIGITSPAGYIAEKEILPAIERLEDWGFSVRLGKTIGKRYYLFGGTDEERRADLQDMIDDRDIKAILCARGGYGVVRIIDQLRFDALKQCPKWIIGFSDVTVLHAHVHRHAGITSLHAKMCNSFPPVWDKADSDQKASVLSIRQVLFGEKLEYTLPAVPQNKTGTARGKLIGGNLKTLESLSGSDSDLQTAGKILFVEDTGEYMYSVDRMFWNLKRSGKLDQLAGLIVGGFKIKEDPSGESFGKELWQIVWEKVHDCGFPVCFDFPVGHQKYNLALKCGVVHQFDVTVDQTVLREV